MASSLEDVSESGESFTVVKVFINNVDSFQNSAIAEILNNVEDPDHDLEITFEIYGSVNKIHQDIRGREFYKYLHDVLDRSSVDYFENIINCDYIIYDIGGIDSKTQILEVEKFLTEYDLKIRNSTLKLSQDKSKYFILVSTPLTWEATKVINDDKLLYETDYRKRRPHPSYVHHKCLEREVMIFEKKSKSQLRTLVVCPGFTYGDRNDIFHYIFKISYLNRGNVPIVTPGNQNVPIIYIRDYARMIKQLITNFPDADYKYIFAVEPIQYNIKTFTRKIVTNFTGNAIRTKIVPKIDLTLYESALFPQYIIDAISANICLQPTYFESFPFSFEEDQRNFEMNLIDEYRAARNLSPIKILIDGPPLVGKTSVALALSKYYQIVYINMESLITDMQRALATELERAKKLHDILIVEKASANNSAADANVAYLIETTEIIDEVINSTSIDLNHITEFLSTYHNEEDQLNFYKRYISMKLSSKICFENHGFIIDGFPYAYEEAAEIFLNSNYITSNNKDNQKMNLLPMHVVLLNAPNDLLVRRARSFDEGQAVAKKSTEHVMLQRLKEYNERNEEDTSLSNFFYDQDIVPITFCIKEDTRNEYILESIKRQIGQPRNYPLTKEQIMRQKRMESVSRLHEDAEKRRARQELRTQIRLKREMKIRQWTNELEQLKLEEESALEAKTVPLRYYLSKFVLPSLTDGILKVAEARPDDPIDFLAEYFFKTNVTGHVMSPNYTEKLKHLLLEDGKETSQVLSLLAENMIPFGCRKKKSKHNEESVTQSQSGSQSNTASYEEIIRKGERNCDPEDEYAHEDDDDIDLSDSYM